MNWLSNIFSKPFEYAEIRYTIIAVVGIIAVILLVLFKEWIKAALTGRLDITLEDGKFNIRIKPEGPDQGAPPAKTRTPNGVKNAPQGQRIALFGGATAIIIAAVFGAIALFGGDSDNGGGDAGPPEPPIRAGDWQGAIDRQIRDISRIKDFASPEAEALLRPLVAQMFVIGVNDPCPLTQKLLVDNHTYDVVQAAQEINFGGYFLRPDHFWHDYKTNEDSTRFLAACRPLVGDSTRIREVAQAAREEAKQPVEWLDSWRALTRSITETSIAKSNTPPFLMIDHEGGAASPFTDEGLTPQIPAAMALTTTGKVENTCVAGFAAGWSARRLGANVVLGPVLDVQVRSAKQALGDRSFSPDGGITSVMGRAYASGLHSAKAISVFKHYPGHGPSIENFHKPGIPTLQNFSVQELESQLQPYREEGLGSDAEMIMSAFFNPGRLMQVQNIAYSSVLMGNLLRGDPGEKRDLTVSVVPGAQPFLPLGFKGVLMSDDITIESMAFPDEKVLLYPTRAAYVSHISEVTRKLFDSGHDMFLYADINCLSYACEKVTSADPKETRALKFSEIGDVLNNLQQHIFLAQDVRERAKRVERLRDSLLRILTLKRKRISLDNVTGELSEKVQTSLEAIWPDSIAHFMQERRRLDVESRILVSDFVDEESPLGRQLTSSGSDAKGGPKAAVDPAPPLGLAAEGLPPSPGFNLGAVRANISVKSVSLTSEIPRVLQKDEGFKNLFGWPSIRCYRKGELPSDVAAKTGQSPPIDAATDPDADRGTNIQEQRVDACRNANFDRLTRFMSDWKRLDALILIARTPAQWVDAIGFATIYRDRLVADGATNAELDQALAKIYLIADGRTNLLYARGGGETYDAAVREKINIIIPFTGYNDHKRNVTKWLVQQMKDGAVQQAKYPPPLDADGLFPSDPPPIMSKACEAPLSQLGLLDKAKGASGSR